VQKEGKKKGPTLQFAWGDLPKKKRRRKTVDRLDPALQHLKDQPGRWAQIAEYPSSSGANNAARSLREAGYIEYEYTSRKAGVGSALWVRFLG
jgi:hypothetical protein